MAKANGVTAPEGYLAGGVHCGLKEDGAKDLAMIVSDRPATAWGVFTKNRIKGAPVIVTRSHLRSGAARGIVVNSGNANTLTRNGIQTATRMATAASRVVGCSTREILVASTGVIGKPLPIEKVEAGIASLGAKLKPGGGAAAAEAIMTTDLVRKECSARMSVGSKPVIIGGCAKGSGMIHPNMATMLGFITTDAAVSKEALKDLVKRANADSFGLVTVDGDTSTSDMLLIMANGASGSPCITAAKGKRYSELVDCVTGVCADLAKKVARDGEGATKFITVTVNGAKTDKAARAIAMSIAKSNLVKTAMFGQDANWGRILCAAGAAGQQIDADRVALKICGVTVFANGGLADDGWESRVTAKLKSKEIPIHVDVACGDGSARVWTCDMSYDYIRINADYRS